MRGNQAEQPIEESNERDEHNQHRGHIERQPQAVGSPRRRCLNCKKRFTTYERIEENIRLTVVKKDGTRVPFDRQKLLTGLERACYKRPVKLDQLQQIVDEVEEEVHRGFDKEVPSQRIGELVIDRLRRLDPSQARQTASIIRVSQSTSTLSRSYFGVQPLQLNAGVGCGELPVRFGVVVVAAVLPGGDFSD